MKGFDEITAASKSTFEGAKQCVQDAADALVANAAVAAKSQMKALWGKFKNSNGLGVFEDGAANATWKETEKIWEAGFKDWDRDDANLVLQQLCKDCLGTLAVRPCHTHRLK
eukprot:1726976-Pyramimonas_sp.AAC.1